MTTQRIALVTGGTRGIGAAISMALKNAGYRVAANYGGNDEAAAAFKSETGIPTFKFDIADFAACQQGVKDVQGAMGGNIDVLVNNAGITRDTMMHKMDEKVWREVIITDLNSCFYVARAVIEGMREKSFGRIINISSVNGQLGQFGQTNYSAAKAGIIGFTKALARESAGKGITVNTVAPGYIETDMIKAVKPEVLAKIVANIPVGRVGQPSEIARGVLFLAADDAGFITGETLSINGGQFME